MYMTFWQGKKCLLVNYKDKMISVFDVDLNTSQMIDLYSDVKKLAMEQGISLPKFVGFNWHPHKKENQRWGLRTNKDWLKLVTHWECLKKVNVIPIYLVELNEASEVQKTVESLGKLQQQQKEQSMTVSTEPNTQLSTQPTISQATV